jgi:hypothetical protein
LLHCSIVVDLAVLHALLLCCLAFCCSIVVAVLLL